MRPVSLKEVRLTPDQREVIASAINFSGEHCHPVADDTTLDGFGLQYARDCAQRELAKHEHSVPEARALVADALAVLDEACSQLLREPRIPDRATFRGGGEDLHRAMKEAGAQAFLDGFPRCTSGFTCFPEDEQAFLEGYDEAAGE